ncbi:MAG: flagellar biosynthetic protein FliO [Veillonellales bacterium]
MRQKAGRFWTLCVICCLVAAIIFSSAAFAADSNGEYLTYQEPQLTASFSWWSTIGYVFSLLLTFALVIGLAYFTSRFLGQKMGRLSVTDDQKILATLPLGPNRAVYVVEIAGKCLVLGVTDHSISLLQELTESEQIEKMRAHLPAAPAAGFDSIFQRQLASLQHMTQKFPAVFDAYNKSSEPKNDREKR